MFSIKKFVQHFAYTFIRKTNNSPIKAYLAFQTIYLLAVSLLIIKQNQKVYFITNKPDKKFKIPQ